MMETFQGAAIAILIGLLLGLERERSQKPDEKLFAGIRTFPLLVLAGYLAALGGKNDAPLLLPATLLAIAALVITAYWKTAGEHVGATTEAVALVAPLLGAAIAFGHRELAAATAVAITLLLTLKAPLHKLAGQVSEEEIFSIVKFGIVALVLLPLLPGRAYGPYEAIVPRHVGMVVVIVSALSLVGYLLVRILGGAGWALTGLLGGLASSTAVTLSLSGKARDAPSLVRSLASGILLANTILYARVAVLIGLFDAPLLSYLAPRLGALLLVGAAFAAVELRGQEKGKPGQLGLGNPVELGKAFVLGLGFAAILLLGRAAEAEFGRTGLWAASALGGLVDVDSVGLANARLHQQGLAATDEAGRAFLLATLANLLVKSGIVVTAGGRALARRVLPGFVALAAATAAALAV